MGNGKDRWEKLPIFLGTDCFEKTLFQNKQTRERAYLLGWIMEMVSHEPLTEDTEAKLLEEAIQTLYRKVGKKQDRSGGQTDCEE